MFNFNQTFSIKDFGEGRTLTREAIDWINATSGGDFHIEQVFEGQPGAWEVQFKRRGEPTAIIAAFETKAEAVELWSNLKQQKIALHMLHGNKAQSRQWFTHGEGQKRVANSTGWTDL